MASARTRLHPFLDSRRNLPGAVTPRHARIQGGTALKRCYFGDYRFSEDLDFTLVEPVPFDEIKRRLEPIYAAVYEGSGITFAFDREDREQHMNSHTFYLKYAGPLPA